LKCPVGTRNDFFPDFDEKAKRKQRFREYTAVSIKSWSTRPEELVSFLIYSLSKFGLAVRWAAICEQTCGEEHNFITETPIYMQQHHFYSLPTIMKRNREDHQLQTWTTSPLGKYNKHVNQTYKHMGWKYLFENELLISIEDLTSPEI
jgi:hypothetical protein